MSTFVRGSVPRNRSRSPRMLVRAPLDCRAGSPRRGPAMFDCRDRTTLHLGNIFTPREYHSTSQSTWRKPIYPFYVNHLSRRMGKQYRFSRHVVLYYVFAILGNGVTSASTVHFTWYRPRALSLSAPTRPGIPFRAVRRWPWRAHPQVEDRIVTPRWRAALVSWLCAWPRTSGASRSLPYPSRPGQADRLVRSRTGCSTRAPCRRPHTNAPPRSPPLWRSPTRVQRRFFPGSRRDGSPGPTRGAPRHTRSGESSPSVRGDDDCGTWARGRWTGYRPRKPRSEGFPR